MDATEIEKKSLEAHVELCAERYRQLESKLETVTEKIIVLHTSISTLRDMLQKSNSKRNDQLLSWGGSAIAVLLGVSGWLAAHYFK